MTSATPKRFSHWLESLRKQWRKAREPKAPRNPEALRYPLDLELGQVQALRRLVLSPQYPHYLELLERVTIQNVEQLLRPLPHDQYLFYVGVVFACRRLMELPHEILSKVTELEDRDHARKRTARVAADAQINPFVNTPWFDSYARDAGLDFRPPDTNGRDLNALG